MGWECPEPNDPIPFYDGEWFDLTDMNKAKLLQAKMVKDGWIVGIEIRPNKVRALIARYCTDQLCPPVEMDAFADTEPAAIVSLFEKIYLGGK